MKHQFKTVRKIRNKKRKHRKIFQCSEILINKISCDDLYFYQVSGLKYFTNRKIKKKYLKLYCRNCKTYYLSEVIIKEKCTTK